MSTCKIEVFQVPVKELDNNKKEHKNKNLEKKLPWKVLTKNCVKISLTSCLKLFEIIV